jgi:hypothetical protein
MALCLRGLKILGKLAERFLSKHFSSYIKNYEYRDYSNETECEHFVHDIQSSCRRNCDQKCHIDQTCFNICLPECFFDSCAFEKHNGKTFTLGFKDIEGAYMLLLVKSSSLKKDFIKTWEYYLYFIIPKKKNI